MAAPDPCVGCRGLFPEAAGPTHRYMESSPGCWKAYGEVLAREYSQPEYMTHHRLTVDAYAVQHPGRPSPQSIQSVAVHLCSLCLVLERAVPMALATEAIARLTKRKGLFSWLPPPDDRGKFTVADVRPAASAAEHVEAVLRWARSSWSAWEAHHAAVRGWLGTGAD